MYELMTNFKYCINKDIKEVIENERSGILSIDCQTQERCGSCVHCCVSPEPLLYTYAASAESNVTRSCYC